MAKVTKYFCKLAEKAERFAYRGVDDDASQQTRNLAEAYRDRADMLRQRRKRRKRISAASNSMEVLASCG